MINFKDKNIIPMKIKEIEMPFNDKDFIFEPKYDGIRVIIYASPNKVIIKNRKGIIVNKMYPELMDIKNMVKKEVIFDGEIVIMENDRPSFSRLQERILLKNENKIEYMKNNYPVIFICFDILYENKDLSNLPLIKRKEILNEYRDTNIFVKTFYILEKGISLFRSVQKLELEGIVAKNKNSKYTPGIRSKEWLKIKNWKDSEFYIGGIYENKKHSMATLVVGEYILNDLVYKAKVTISKKSPEYDLIIKQKEINKSPFIDFNDKLFKYIKPNIKCTITYIEKTKSNHLRQPQYKGIRFD